MTDREGSNSPSEMYPLGVIALNSPELIRIQSGRDDNLLLKRCNLNLVASAQLCIYFSKVRSVLSLKEKTGQNFPLGTNLLHILNAFHA